MLTETDSAGASESADAATAAYWLTQPEIVAAAVNTLDKWESEPEWTGPAEEEQPARNDAR